MSQQLVLREQVEKDLVATRDDALRRIAATRTDLIAQDIDVFEVDAWAESARRQVHAAYAEAVDAIRRDRVSSLRFLADTPDTQH